MKYILAPEIKTTVSKIVEKLEFDYIKIENIHCIRSLDANTRAIARIWGMSRLFKEVAGIEPNYIIEVNAKRFDKLGEKDRIRVLVHELMHIPKTFSGALLSHKGRYHRINNREVEKLFKKL